MLSTLGRQRKIVEGSQKGKKYVLVSVADCRKIDAKLKKAATVVAAKPAAPKKKSTKKPKRKQRGGSSVPVRRTMSPARADQLFKDMDAMDVDWESRSKPIGVSGMADVTIETEFPATLERWLAERGY